MRLRSPRDVVSRKAAAARAGAWRDPNAALSYLPGAVAIVRDHVLGSRASSPGARHVNAVSKLVANIHGVYRACGAGTALAFAANIAGTLPAVARTRTLGDADRRMSSRPHRFRAQGVDVVLDGRLWTGAREMYGRGVYFPEERFDLVAGTTVVDLGANSGLFTLLAALRGCRVLAIEAQAGFIREIGELALRYGVQDRVVLAQALAGGGQGLLAQPGVLEAASHFDGRQPERITMPQLFERHGIEAVDFLKCDIEGSEFELFEAPEAWLPRVRRIAMEVHCAFGSVPGLVRRLEADGFEVGLRDDLGRRVPRILQSSGYLFAIRRAA
jgi:FkbM family methyltransferase